MKIRMKKLVSIAFIVIIFFGSVGAITKTAIKPHELMKEITNDIATNFADYLILEAFKVNNNGVISYEVILKHEALRLTIYYNDNGKFIRKALPPKSSKALTEKLSG